MTGRGDAIPATRSPRQPGRPGTTVGRVLPGLAVVGLTAIGAALRLPALTDAGLWRDDAWVALVGRVGPGMAWDMSATAPLFTAGMWAWLHLGDPMVAWWAQLPPMALGIAAVPAVYAVHRWFAVPRPGALVAAAVVATAPVAMTYSARVKPYGLDLLVACALLVATDLARRTRRPRDLGVLVVVATVGFAASASVAPAVAGAFGALALDLSRTRDRWRNLAATLAVGALGTAAVYLACYRRLPEGLTPTWHLFYVDLSSPGRAVDTGGSAAGRVLAGLAPGGGWITSLPAAVLVGALGALVGLGLLAGRRAWTAALTVAASFAAAAARAAPIGTGRLDEVLYPSLLLLAALGTTVLVERWAPPTPDRAPRWRPVLTGAVTVLVVGALVARAATSPATYPATDIDAIRAARDEVARPGDLVIVDARTRYLWALTQPGTPAIVLGDRWLPGFTVTANEPGVAFQSSYSMEAGYTPRRWADEAEGAERILYVSTPFEIPEEARDDAYAELRRRGWTPTEVRDVAGGRLEVLERAS